MKVIKKSVNGIDYAGPCKLKIKQKVHSSAMLMRIPHNDPDKRDVALKIGRYRFDQVETNEPKSELTLDNDELNNLIQYLEQNYMPVKFGAGKYMPVQDDSAEVLQKFKTLLEKQNGVAELLLDHDILTENVFVAVTAIKKRRALDNFAENIKSENPESFWQKWFKENKWMLGSDFARIIDDRRIDSKNIADYIMRAFDGFVDLVEIKKPNGMPFWASVKDHDNYVPSADLIKAITQCLNYIHAIELEANSTKFIERTKSKIIKPRCILIFGRSNNWNEKQREAYRILNAAYHQISILTYDHLLMRAENILEIEEHDDIPF